MRDPLPEILREFEEHKGEFIIHSKTVYRLIGVGQDDHDYFYILYTGNKLVFGNVLTGNIYLKGKIDDSDYKEFQRLARLNHHDLLIKKYNPEKYKDFVSHLSTPSEGDEYLTELYLEI